MTVEDTKRFPAAPSPDRTSAGAVKKEDEAAAGDGGSANAAAAAAASLTFEAFAARNPLRAKQYINQLSEFTGVHDQQLLVTALNKVKGPADFQDRLPGAIEWILENRHTYHNQQHQAQQQPSSPTGAPHQQQPFGPGGNFRKAPSPLGNSAAAQTMSPGELLRSKQQRHLPPGVAASAASAAAAANMPPPPAVAFDRSETLGSSVSSTSSPSPFTQPPNSPERGVPAGGAGGDKPKIVDLTDNSSDQGGAASSAGAGGGGIGDAESDLQKAIKLSLQENRAGGSFGGGHFSQEDQDVSRALEQSLMDSQGGIGRKGGSTWVDPLNPHDRERKGLWPVGLKNVGQTCWFSAVIQSLFYIPAFRNLVLGFRPTPPPPPANGLMPAPGDERAGKIADFMSELRKLFALLVASERKYVDPSKAVDLLRKGFGGGNNEASSAGQANAGAAVDDGISQQEDVSECTHILFAWMEEAFNCQKKNGGGGSSEDAKKDESMEVANTSTASASEAASDQAADNNAEKVEEGGGGGGAVAEDNGGADKSDDVDNPMSRLFYGRIQVEGKVQGGLEEFSRSETFTQHSLQVNACSDIHESIENSTAEENMENASSQERWFTELPPVLFFSLSRFQFNVDKRIAEKIHNRLDFPELVYMDRYMSENRQVTRQKRQLVQALKKKREELQTRLKTFTDYGEGDQRLPLPLILQYAMQFAAAGPNSPASGQPQQQGDVIMPSPHVPDASGCNNANANSQQHQEQAPSSSAPALHPAASSHLMQVDSPCPSPGMTPATSLTCLASATGGGASEAAAASAGDVDAMDVEMANEEDEDMAVKCDDAVVKEQQQPTSEGEQQQQQQQQEMAVAGPTEQPMQQGQPVYLPHPKHVSEVEMRVIQTCMTRWKSEVESSISALTSSLREVDDEVGRMYEEPELRRLEYRLHAVMVHEGSVNSGHYWAYVLDARRGAWLKFNDNSVSEATWDELQKESVGGHSNASAYSLVYLRSSKSEMLMSADQEQQGEKMEQGAVDQLLSSLPNDLAEYVADDNSKFRDERNKWDADQEEKRKRESVQAATSTTGTQMKENDSNGECEVVEERLTYVNTHAKLVATQTIDVLTQVERFVTSDSSAKSACDKAAEKVAALCRRRMEELTGPECVAEARLESFVIYLVRNGCPDQMVRMAVLEQLCLPGLENRSPQVAGVVKAAENVLGFLRTSRADDARALKEWHQAYHTFRLSAHCFIKGADALEAEKYEEALEMLNSCYTLLIRITDRPPKALNKCMKTQPVLNILCMALHGANASIIKRLKVGDDLPHLKQTVQDLIVPAMSHLESRLSRVGDPAQELPPDQISLYKLAEKALEDSRQEWCNLLTEDLKGEEQQALTEMLSVVLNTQPSREPQEDLGSRIMASERMTMQDDLTLAKNYARVLQRLTRDATAPAVVVTDTTVSKVS